MSWSFPIAQIDESEFLMILDQIGKDVTIRKIDESGSIHCDCYDDDYRTFDPLCPICSGTGRSTTFKDTPTIAEIQLKQPPALAGTDNLYTRIGDFKREYANGYFRKDEDIDSEDYIILSYMTDRPIYRVTQVREYLGSHDNIVLLFVQMRKEVSDTSGT